MPKNVPAELEALAGEFGIDATDPNESIGDLIDRVRDAVDYERTEADEHFVSCLNRLDDHEADHADDEDDEQIDAA